MHGYAWMDGWVGGWLRCRRCVCWAACEELLQPDRGWIDSFCERAHHVNYSSLGAEEIKWVSPLLRSVIKPKREASRQREWTLECEFKSLETLASIGSSNNNNNISRDEAPTHVNVVQLHRFGCHSPLNPCCATMQR